MSEDDQKRQRIEEELSGGFCGVKSLAQAEGVLTQLESAAGAKRDEGIRVDEVARRVEDPAGEKLAAVAERAAQNASGENEAVDAAVGVPAKAGLEPRAERGRTLLQVALLRRLRLVDRIDAELFLVINGFPHPRVLDGFFSRLSWWMTGGHAWALVPLAMLVWNPSRGLRVFFRVMPAIWLTTALLEYPIKRTFRRKRPFIATVRAIVVGRKPGSFSFPSGHSAAAAAGAMALSVEFPRLAPGFWTLAGLVKFSRVYLGAHYPGDVISGAVLGAVLGRFVRSAVARLLR